MACTGSRGSSGDSDQLSGLLYSEQMGKLVKVLLGPYRVRVMKLRDQQRWRVAEDIDVGHCVMRKSSYHASLELAEVAAAARREELNQGLVPVPWARSIAAFAKARAEEPEETEETKD